MSAFRPEPDLETRPAEGPRRGPANRYALDASIATFERTFEAASHGAAAFNRKIIDIAHRNVNSVFDLAKSLSGAKKLADIVELQAAH
jgi:hypothetical protein